MGRAFPVLQRLALALACCGVVAGVLYRGQILERKTFQSAEAAGANACLQYSCNSALFNALPTSAQDIDALTNTKAVSTFVEFAEDFSDQNLYVGVVRANGADVSFGTKQLLTNDGDFGKSVALTSTKFVTVYNSTYHGAFAGTRMVVGTVSGTSISLGTPLNAVAYDGSAMDIVRLSDTQFLVLLTDDASGVIHAIVGTVSGTNISLGSDVDDATPAIKTMQSAVTVDSSKVAITYWVLDEIEFVPNIYTRIISIAADTPTFNAATPVSFYASSSSIALIDGTHVFIAFGEGGSGKAAVGTISGTNITVGDAEPYDTNVGDLFGVPVVVRLSANQFAILSHNQDGPSSSVGTGYVANVSGTNVSISSAKTPIGQAGLRVATPLSEHKVLMAYGDGNDSDHGTVAVLYRTSTDANSCPASCNTIAGTVYEDEVDSVTDNDGFDDTEDDPIGVTLMLNGESVDTAAANPTYTFDFPHADGDMALVYLDNNPDDNSAPPFTGAAAAMVPDMWTITDFDLAKNRLVTRSDYDTFSESAFADAITGSSNDANLTSVYDMVDGDKLFLNAQELFVPPWHYFAPTNTVTAYNVEVADSGTLSAANMGAGEGFKVRGHWEASNAGFDAYQSFVTLQDGGSQIIRALSNYPFYDLNIGSQTDQFMGTTVTASGTLSVSNNLNVYSDAYEGNTLRFSSGATLKNVNIYGKSTLIAATGSTLTIRGNWVATGAFIHGRGTALFAGANGQTLSNSGSSLYNVQIEAATESGLVANFKFDYANSTIFYDTSGNGYSGYYGYMQNGAAQTAVVPSTKFPNPKSLQLDGTNDYAIIGNSDTALKQNTGDFSIAMWLKFGAIPNYPMVASNSNNDLGGWFFTFNSHWCGANTIDLAKQRIADQCVTIPTALATGTWYHFAAIQNYSGASPSNVTYYMNGVNIGTYVDTQSFLAANGSWIFGQAFPGWSTYFNGNIDDFRIYDRPLTALEVKNLAGGKYANGSTGEAITLGSDLIVDGVLGIYNGRIVSNNKTITLSGSWLNYSGSGGYIAGQGTVVFNGSATQSVAGSGNTFYNLTVRGNQPGLVGYWRFDEGTGTTAYDTSGYNHTGTLTNGPWWQSGNGNIAPVKYYNPHSLVFDGTNDFVKINDSSRLNLTSNITIAAWVYRSNVESVIVPLTRRTSSTLQYQLTWRPNGWNGHTSFDLGLGGGVVSTESSSAHVGTGWHHIVGTYDRSNVKLYFDGVSDGTTAETRVIDSYNNDLAIGFDIFGFYTQATLDDIRIYNRALTSTEVASLAAGHQLPSGGIVSLDSDIVVLRNLNLQSGKLAAGSRAITLSGAWLNSVGTGAFVPGTSRVVLNGTTPQLMMGSGSFYDLTLLQGQSGLISHWRFDEGTGTNAHDSSENRNEGTLTNMPASPWVTSTATGIHFQNDYALDFDGTNDYVNTTYNLKDTGVTEAFTISTWFRSEKSSGIGMIAEDGTSYLTDTFYLGTNNTNQMIAKVDTFVSGHGAGASNDAISVGTIQNVWTHAALRYDGSAAKLYVNGAEVWSGSVTGRILDGSTSLQIGRRPDGSLFFDGQIDDFRIYRRALSPSEITKLAAGKPLETGFGSMFVGANLSLAHDFKILSGAAAWTGTHTVALSGSWLNYGSGAAISPGGGTVRFSGGSGQTLVGTGTFYNLSKIITDSQTMYFGARSLFTVNGTMTLAGLGISPLLKLRSTIGGVEWFIQPIATRVVEFLDVQDSYNTDDEDIECFITTLSCVNSGNNTNWFFQTEIPEVAIWDGSESTDWSNADNWDTGQIPGTITDVFIPNVANDPQLTGSGMVKNLVIYSGATLDLKGKELGFYGGGTLQGGGILRVRGDETISNLVNASTGTVLYYGSGTYSNLVAGDSYYNITIEDSTESNLMAYLKFDEGSDLSAYDSTGRGHTGTLGNGTAWTTNKAPTTFFNPHALDFDGSDDQVTVARHNDIEPQQLTVAAWIYTQSMSEVNGVIFDKANTSGVDPYFDYHLRLNSLTELQGAVVVGNSWGVTDTTTATVPSLQNRWAHVAMTFDGTNIVIYEDGAPAAVRSNPGSITYHATDLHIGGFRNTTSGNFDGYIDDVRIYNVALGQSHIQKLLSGQYANGYAGTATYTLDAALTARRNITIQSGKIAAGSNNITLSGSWLNYSGTGGFVAGTSRVIFDGSAAQTVLSNGASFYNLTAINTAGSPSDSVDVDTDAVIVTNELLVSDGQFQPDTGSDFVNVLIELGSILKPYSGAEITVSGDWIRDGGTFTHNDSTVTFDGDAAQEIVMVGSSFYNLTINNSAATPSDVVDVDSDILGVDNTLTVSDGQFQPAAGTGFKDVTIDSSGILKPDPSITIAVSGNWSVAGSFIHNSGTVAFDGDATQLMTTNGNAFYNLTVSNTRSNQDIAIDADTVTVANNLLLTDGWFQPASGSVLKNVTITYASVNVIGALTADTGAYLHVSGNWTQSGAFANRLGTVVFDGTGSQIISAWNNGPYFYNLTINNTAASPSDSLDVDVNGNIGITNNLHILDGQFQPPADSALYKLYIDENGILKPDAGVQVLSQYWTNSGTFLPNGGTVAIDVPGQIFTDETFYNLKASAPGGSFDARVLHVTNDFTLENFLTVTFDSGSTFNDIFIHENATLSPNPSAIMTVSGNWTQTGSFLHGTGTVVFDGTTQKIYGAGEDNTVFYNFTAETPSQTLQFESGTGNAISVEGTWTVQGSNNGPGAVTLRSVIPGQNWHSYLRGLADINHVAVRDGMEHTTAIGLIDTVGLNDDGGVDDGNNFNWFAVICGDSEVEGDEECDDGGTADGDGCSAICEFETSDTGVTVSNTLNVPVKSSVPITVRITNAGQTNLTNVELDTPTISNFSLSNLNGGGCTLTSGTTYSCSNIPAGSYSTITVVGSVSAATACSTAFTQQFLLSASGGLVTVNDGANASVFATCTCGDSYLQPQHLVNSVSPETCDDGNLVGGDGCSSVCQQDQIQDSGTPPIPSSSSSASSSSSSSQTSSVSAVSSSSSKSSSSKSSTSSVPTTDFLNPPVSSSSSSAASSSSSRDIPVILPPELFPALPPTSPARSIFFIKGEPPSRRIRDIFFTAPIQWLRDLFNIGR